VKLKQQHVACCGKNEINGRIMTKTVIEHKGKIDSISGNKIKVHFLNVSACASCHAKGVCTASDMEDKEIEVYDTTGKFHEGEDVKILLQQSLGYRALLFGYVVPFFLVLIGLFTLNAFTSNEVIMGVGALGVLVPYYLIIYYLKDRFEKVFSFNIQKLA
jgi:sigma-E factor negative regulatory protein RseC